MFDTESNTAALMQVAENVKVQTTNPYESGVAEPENVLITSEGITTCDSAAAKQASSGVARKPLTETARAMEPPPVPPSDPARELATPPATRPTPAARQQNTQTPKDMSPPHPIAPSSTPTTWQEQEVLSESLAPGETYSVYNKHMISMAEKLGFQSTGNISQLRSVRCARIAEAVENQIEAQLSSASSILQLDCPTPVST